MKKGKDGGKNCKGKGKACSACRKGEMEANCRQHRETRAMKGLKKLPGRPWSSQKTGRGEQKSARHCTTERKRWILLLRSLCSCLTTSIQIFKCSLERNYHRPQNLPNSLHLLSSGLVLSPSPPLEDLDLPFLSLLRVTCCNPGGVSTSMSVCECLVEAWLLAPL